MKYENLKSIPNPVTRPKIWRNFIGWLKWRKTVVWCDGITITAEEMNKQIQAITKDLEDANKGLTGAPDIS